jgi:hypothetical protein
VFDYIEDCFLFATNHQTAASGLIARTKGVQCIINGVLMRFLKDSDFKGCEKACKIKLATLFKSQYNES